MIGPSLRMLTLNRGLKTSDWRYIASRAAPAVLRIASAVNGPAYALMSDAHSQVLSGEAEKIHSSNRVSAKAGTSITIRPGVLRRSDQAQSAFLFILGTFRCRYRCPALLNLGEHALQRGSYTFVSMHWHLDP